MLFHGFDSLVVFSVLAPGCPAFLPSYCARSFGADVTATGVDFFVALGEESGLSGGRCRAPGSAVTEGLGG